MALFIRLTHSQHDNEGVTVHVNMDRIVTMVRLQGSTLLMTEGIQEARAVYVEETPEQICLMMAQEKMSLPI